MSVQCDGKLIGIINREYFIFTVIKPLKICKMKFDQPQYLIKSYFKLENVVVLALITTN